MAERGLQARMGGNRHGLEARTLETGCEHRVLTQREGKLRVAIVVGMRVKVRMGASLGAKTERLHIGEGVGARRCRRGAQGYRGRGYKLTFPQVYFASLSSRSTPCPSTPSMLCKELWFGRLTLKLVGGRLCSFLFVR